jgi:RimJ/RimL family protein N-acetyltransferase
MNSRCTPRRQEADPMSPPARPAEHVPVLETERLILRGHRIEDFDACLALWTDPDSTQFIGGKPSTREEVWARMLRYVGHWRLQGFGYWVVVEKATGRFVGEVGFGNFKRDIEPSLDGMPEIGWVLAPPQHGKGYATEAAQAAIAWAEGHFGPVRTACIIAPDNAPSIRVAERCGYREFQRTTYKGNPTIMYVR